MTFQQLSRRHRLTLWALRIPFVGLGRVPTFAEAYTGLLDGFAALETATGDTLTLMGRHLFDVDRPTDQEFRARCIEKIDKLRPAAARGVNNR